MYTTVNIHCKCWDIYQPLCKRMLTCYRYVGNCDCIGCFKVTYWVLGPLFCNRRVAVFLAVRILTEYAARSGSSAMRTLSIWMYVIHSDRSLAGRMTHSLRHVHTHICLGIYELHNRIKDGDAWMFSVPITRRKYSVLSKVRC
jgi:hypothetical protein